MGHKGAVFGELWEAAGRASKLTRGRQAGLPEDSTAEWSFEGGSVSHVGKACCRRDYCKRGHHMWKCRAVEEHSIFGEL